LFFFHIHRGEGSEDIVSKSRGRFNRRLDRLKMACAAAAVSLIWCGGGLGATYTFQGASFINPPGILLPNWAYPPNWQNSAVPPTTDDTSDIIFNLVGGAVPIATQDLADPLYIHSITFNQPYTSNGGGLAWDAGGFIHMNSNTNLLNQLYLTGTVIYDGAGSGHLGGPVTGSGTLKKDGVGTLTLDNASCNFHSLELWGGNVNVNGGLLALSSIVQPLLMVGNRNMTVSGGAVLETRPGEARFTGDSSFGPTIRITGPGTIWRAGKIMDGYYGNYASSVIVEDNASISEATLLSIGTADTPVSTMLVQSGGKVTVTDAVIGGVNPNSHGSATVTGFLSQWTINNNLDLGGNASNPTGGVGEIVVSDNGTVQSANTKLWNNAATITVNSGSFIAGSLTGSGSIHVNNSAGNTGYLIFGSSVGSPTFSGSITGNGNVAKSGPGTQILAGANTYTGVTSVYAGTLRLNSGASANYIAEPGGTLILGFSNLGTSSVQANIGGTVKYDNGAMSGGFLEGQGTHDIQNVAGFNGTTIGLNVHFNPTAPMQLNNVTNNGLIADSAGNILNWNHGVNGQFARLDVGYATTNVSDVINNGAIRLFNGTLNNSVTPLVTTAGSSITITSDVGGSTLNLGGQTLEVNGGLVINDGTINGTTNVNSGGIVRGKGVFGPVNVLAGGKVSPGNSAGSFTTGSAAWASTGTYQFEINDAAGSAGVNWDLWNINGALTITAGTAASRFVIAVNSLNSGNTAGDAAGFIKEENYSWLIATTTTPSDPLDNRRLVVDSTNFTNSTAGSFSLSRNGNNTYLNYNATIAPPQWNVDGSGSWAAPADNWLPVGVPNGPTALANFLGKITAPRTVTLDGDKTVRTIFFDNANAYTITSGSGGTLTVGDGSVGTINVISGSHTISAPLTFAGNINKIGAGTLTINSPQAQGALTVTAGQVTLSAATATPNFMLAIGSNGLGSNSKVTLGSSPLIQILDSNHAFKSLSVAFGDPGTQTLDLASLNATNAFTSVSVFAADLDATKIALYNAIANANSFASVNFLDGIIDTGLQGHPSSEGRHREDRRSH
jgi:fibronectin-binding autotransporter adhesin